MIRRLLLIASGVVVVQACNSPTQPPPPPPQTAAHLNIGNVLLSAVGQTAQLTATGILPDNSTEDVTAQVTWSGPSSVVSVSSTGLVTATALGAALISARLKVPSKTLYTESWAVVTPPGTFVAIGFAYDPTSTAGLSGVTVLAQSGQSTVSAPGDESNGDFMLPGLTDGLLTFTKNGYTTVTVDTSTEPVDCCGLKSFFIEMQPVTGPSIKRLRR